jgi:hypothetical protein
MEDRTMDAERAKKSNDEPRAGQRESREREAKPDVWPHASYYARGFDHRPRLPTSCCICINRRPGDNPAPDCLADFHMVDYG